MTDSPATGPITVAGEAVHPGERRDLEVAVARLPSGAVASMPVTVVRGTQPGPGFWLTAAVHGDEIIGTEVIRQVLSRLDPAALRGDVVAMPVVNVHGFASGSRYLPDRRDLNRSFPGSARGSLASRLARLVLDTCIEPCDVGIDLHSGSDNRSNLPQVRGDLNDEPTRELAVVFGAPAMVHSRVRDGSLRAAAVRAGKTALVFEGGEALRFDEDVIDVAVAGVLRSLAHFGMIDGITPPADTPFESLESSWVRAPASGLLRPRSRLGERVVKGEVLGAIADAFGNGERPVRAPRSGMIIGRTENPVVYRGDALFHVAAVHLSAENETRAPDAQPG